MSIIRFNALNETLKRKPVQVQEISAKRSDLFGASYRSENRGLRKKNKKKKWILKLENQAQLH